MISRALLIASTVGIAMTLAGAAHADGFNVGSFMLGNGGKSWVPKCNAPQVLAEVKDNRGQTRWICVNKQQAAGGAPQSTVRSAWNAQR